MNYAALKAAVIDWVKRGDVTSSLIATWVILAEQRIYTGTRDMPGLRLQTMLAEDATFAVNAALPDGFLEPERLTISIGGVNRPLDFKPSAAIAEIEGQGGDPVAYTIRGGSLFVGPTTTDTADFWYYARPDTPSADVDENVVMRDYPSLYLNAVLMEAATWTRDDELLQRHTALWKDAMEAASNADRASRWGNTPLRVVSDQRVRA